MAAGYRLPIVGEEWRKKFFFQILHIDTNKEIVILLTKKMKPIIKYKIYYKLLPYNNLQKKEYHHGHCKNFKR